MDKVLLDIEKLKDANREMKYSWFEAIHGTAPRMGREGRYQYADHISLLRAGAMLLEHIGCSDLGTKLHKALDICGQYERKVVMTGRSNGATSREMGDYLLATIQETDVDATWAKYTGA